MTTCTCIYTQRHDVWNEISKDFILLQYDSNCTKKGATYHNYRSLQTIYDILPNVMEKSKHIEWLLNLLNWKYKVKFQFYSSKNWLFFILVIFVEILLNWIFFSMNAYQNWIIGVCSSFRGFHMEEDSILSQLFGFNIFNLILEEKKLFKPWTISNHLFLIERILLTFTQFHFVKSTTI